jgi:ABC-type nitrate/sulfonate/bicarbonate transport system ATPase subunit
VFQSYALFPHMTVEDNVAYGLRMKGVRKQERRRRAGEMLELVQLEHARLRRPMQLSGGMQQRVALARALVNDPDVLLLDEPLGALDALTREEMREWLLEVWESDRKTILLVTHDVEEAVFLSDRVYVMSGRPGRIRATVEVPLRRPRAQELTTTPEFIALEQRVRAPLREARSGLA